MKVLHVFLFIMIVFCLIGCTENNTIFPLYEEEPSGSSEPAQFDDIIIETNAYDLGYMQITDGQCIELGYRQMGINKYIGFTIKNLRDTSFYFAGEPFVSVSGKGFSLYSDLDDMIEPDDYKWFYIIFSPEEPGNYSADIVLKNRANDTFTFSITATVFAGPFGKILAMHNNDETIDNDSIIFLEEQQFNRYQTIYISFYNIGNDELVLEQPQFENIEGLELTSSHRTETIAPGEVLHERFTLKFHNAGTCSGIISLANNDPLLNPFIINVKGTFSGGLFQLKEGETEIPDGSIDYNIGECTVGQSVDITFTLSNTGMKDLGKEDTRILIWSTPPFSIKKLCTPVIKAGESSSFVMTFKPESEGVHSRIVNIRYTDSQRSYTFTFELTGRGTSY